VREAHYRGTVFYARTGIHNVTGEHVSLEVSTDLDEHVEVVHSARQHLPWGAISTVLTRC